MIDIRELERIEFYRFRFLFSRICFQMPFLEWFVVRPVTECIEHRPYFDTFLHFFAQQVEQCIGYGVIAKIKIFQMNVVFCPTDGFEQVLKFFPSAFDKFHLIIIGYGIFEYSRNCNTRESLRMNCVVSSRCINRLSIFCVRAVPIERMIAIIKTYNFKNLSLYLVLQGNKDTTSLFLPSFCQEQI